MRGFRIALVLLAVASGGIVTPAAQAAFPGQNGRIAFIQDLCVPADDPPTNATLMWINPDGSDWDIGPDACFFPNYSPTGTRLMFDWVQEVDDIGYFHLGFINPDGSGRSDAPFGQTYSPDADHGPDGRIVHRCANSSGICVRSGGIETEVVSGSCFTSPAWSPDGSRIALNSSGCDGQRGIVTVPPAGGPVELVVPGDFTASPDWSPDGTRIVYTNRTSLSAPSDLYSANVDGTGVVQLTNSSQHETQPAWSPDGTQIVFVRPQLMGEGPLYRMNADGTGVMQIPAPAYGRSPDWQPLPVNTPSAYPRPVSASPVKFSLVPAYAQCTAPNHEHGPPLAFGSCAPPQPGSSRLMVGIGDGHPAPARSTGVLRLRVILGAPGGADDTSGLLHFNLTNVQRVSDLSEYTGELRGSVRVRITDKEGAVSSTRMDFPLEFAVPCTPTESTQLKSTCELTADLDALLPGATPEQTRAIWQLDQVKVFDGGADEDGDTEGDNALFAVPGVFVP